MATTPEYKLTSEQRLAELEQLAARIKRVLYWGASRDTEGLVHAVVERWALSEDIRDNSDNYAEARRRLVDQLGVVPESLIGEAALRGIVDDAQLFGRVQAEVERLKQGTVDERARSLLSAPAAVGAVLGLILSGQTDHEVATNLKLEPLQVEGYLVDGIRYLTKLAMRDIETARAK